MGNASSVKRLRASSTAVQTAVSAHRSSWRDGVLILMRPRGGAAVGTPDSSAPTHSSDGLPADVLHRARRTTDTAKLRNLFATCPSCLAGTRGGHSLVARWFADVARTFGVRSPPFAASPHFSASIFRRTGRSPGSRPARLCVVRVVSAPRLLLPRPRGVIMLSAGPCLRRDLAREDLAREEGTR